MSLSTKIYMLCILTSKRMLAHAFAWSKTIKNTLPVVFFRSLATKLLDNLGVLWLGAFFRLFNYPLPMVGR